MSNPMRDVLFVTQTAYVGGGMEHWLVALAHALPQLGNVVRVILVEGPRFHRPSRFLERHPLNVPTAVVRGSLGLREERVSGLLAVFRESPRAVVIPVGVADAADAVGVGKRMGLDLRLVTCLHGIGPIAIAEIVRCARDTDIAVSVSRHGANALLAEADLPPSCVRHIPFGVEDPATATPPRQGEGPLRAAYVGRLDQPEKRVRDLIAIVALMKVHPFVLDIVGDGPERSVLEQALRDEVAAGRVRFHGYLAAKPLRSDIYARIDALIVLSPAEGGPNAAWEAMAQGVIPVTSDFLGRSEEPIWRPESNCLVFPVGDVAQAAAQLTRLRDGELRLRLSAAASELPPMYRRESFARAWQEVVVEVDQVPSRYARLPARIPTSPGRLAGVPRLRSALRRVQRLAGLLPAPLDAGGEWPGAYPDRDPRGVPSLRRSAHSGLDPPFGR